jgi:signal transduction histidine kinase
VSRFEHAGVKQLQRLVDAVISIGDVQRLEVTLRRITETAVDLVGATYGALGVLDPEHTRLAQFITVGLDEAAVARIGHRPDGHGILGLLIADPRPLRLPDLRAHPDSFGFPPNHPPMTSFLGVPITVRGVVFGNLYLTDKAEGDVFSDIDEELVVGLATAAGIAIENVRLHDSLRELTLFDERERIARDLHDDVIQRIFATGLALQSAAQMSTDARVTDRISRAIDDLDGTIRRVRSTIFQLQRPVDAPTSVRGQLVTICNEAAEALGFEPELRIDGPIDSALAPSLADHLLLVVREALSNVARHANASAVTVDVSARAGRLLVVVVDDGDGFVAAAVREGSGLKNLRSRAEELGGTFAIDAGQGTGTTISWEAPY